MFKNTINETKTTVVVPKKIILGSVMYTDYLTFTIGDIHVCKINSTALQDATLHDLFTGNILVQISTWHFTDKLMIALLQLCVRLG